MCVYTKDMVRACIHTEHDDLLRWMASIDVVWIRGWINGHRADDDDGNCSVFY